MSVQVAAAWPATVLEAASGALTVWVGAPDALTALPHHGLVLLVEADPAMAQRWRHAWPQRSELLVCEQVVAASSNTPVRWCRFNDARLNGPLDLQTWQAHYPNLRQLADDQLPGGTLADLLQGAGAPCALGAGLDLHLQQGDPLAALAGLGPWLQELRSVELAFPAAATAHWAPALAAWLEPRGFRGCPGHPARWQRDPIASQRLLAQERDLALARVQELEAQNAHQAQQLALILRELDELQALLDQELASAP